MVTTGFASGAVEGTVLDGETSKPIVGANVVILGTDQGGTTDGEGRFKIEWEGVYPVTLLVSHIAYDSKEMDILFPGSVTVSLASKILRGEEVFVVGERTRSQREVSTAMDVVEIESIESQGARDVGSALRRISSLYVDQSSSGAQTVSIRGSNANEVAVYLDGVKINSANTGVADLSQIDLYSIDRIEVLRGGNAYLFGQGNLGGVLNLSSHSLAENDFSFDWGEGLSFDDDLDLSVGGSRVLGPLAFGGRFSGRYRAYEGRTLTASGFSSLLGDLDFSKGKTRARWYRLQNALTYPSGKVASGDQQTVGSVHYTGNILGTSGWELFSGNRSWFEVNNFFVNMNQELDDKTVSYRIGKSLHLRILEASFQIEREDQTFTADRTFRNPDRNTYTDSDNELSRLSDGLVLATRWMNQNEEAALLRFHVEVSGRFDRIVTHRRQQQVTSSASGVRGSPEQNSARGVSKFLNKRIGFRMEGLSDRFRYALFAGQGSNHRPPTLNDLFIQANTSSDSLRNAPLAAEYLNTSEINLEVALVDIPTIPILFALEAKGAYFKNNYDNKIGYKDLKGRFEEPPVPYNEANADINGFELSLAASAWGGKFRLQASAIRLNIENLTLFPNKPDHRYVVAADWNLDWLSVSFDHFREGERFVIGKGFSRLIEPRKNANLNVTVNRNIGSVHLSLSYTLRNLLSMKKKGQSSELDILFFNYYDEYRQILTLRARL